jgi:hypothetical protein
MLEDVSLTNLEGAVGALANCCQVPQRGSATIAKRRDINVYFDF